MPIINIDKLKRTIESLQNLDLKSVEIGDFMPSLNIIFNGFVKACPVFPPLTKIFRAVRWDDRPTNIKQLIHPPDDLIKKLGRVNAIGVSYFYGCSNWEPTLFELKVKKGDHVTLSLFDTLDELQVFPIGFTRSAFARLNSSRTPPKETKPQNVPLIERENNKIVDEFLSDAFTQVVQDGEEYKYKISVAISKFFMSNGYVDGVIYPTISMKADSDNFALKTTSVFRKLRLSNTIYAKVGENNGIFYQIIPEYVSNRFSINGNLYWAKVKNHENQNNATIIESMPYYK